MYAWIWRRLPGPTPVRVLVATALVAAVVALLFLVVFPEVATVLNPDDGGALGHGGVPQDVHRDGLT